MLNLICSLLCLLLAMGLSGCGGQAAKPPEAKLDQPLPEYQARHTKLNPEQKYIQHVLQKKGYTNGSKPTVIVVHKLARKLTLYRGTTALKTYKIVLGNDPYNDKLRQGDTCTPEGVYRVVCKYPHRKWDYFILLDYPNTQNWLKFSRAKKKGKVPFDADIGGSIGYFFPWAYRQRVAAIYHGVERRRSPRISLVAPSELRSASESIDCEAASLSAGGARLNAACRAEVGDSVQLELPGVGRLNSQIVRKGVHETVLRFQFDQGDELALRHYIGDFGLAA